MKVYMVRHGETAFNKQGRLMGQLDEPLDAHGIAQSEEVAKQIPDNIQKIYASPLQRAKKTAEIINARLHVPLETSDLLRERNFGSLAGKTWAEIKELTGKDLEREDYALHYDYHVFGGESVEDVHARVANFIQFLKNHSDQQPVMVVTHFGIIELAYLLAGKDSGITSRSTGENGTIRNDSIHEFDF